MRQNGHIYNWRWPAKKAQRDNTTRCAIACLTELRVKHRRALTQIANSCAPQWLFVVVGVPPPPVLESVGGRPSAVLLGALMLLDPLGEGEAT